MTSADWIIDLALSAADASGQIAAQGPPEEVAKCAESATDVVMAKAFAREHDAVAEMHVET